MGTPCSAVDKLVVIVKEGTTVDDLVVLSACTSIAVAIAECLFLSKTRPDWLVCALVLLFSASAGGLLFAKTTGLGLIHLFIYLLCGTCHPLFLSHQYRKVKQSSIQHIYVKSLLSCLPYLAFAVVMKWSKTSQLTHISQRSGLLLAISCITSFLASYCSWEVPAKARTAAGFAAMTSCSKLISLVFNLLLWDQHGLPWANMLLAGAILAVQVSHETNCQSSQRKHQPSNSKAYLVVQNPAKHVVGILKVVAVIAAVLWVGVTLGTTVTRGHSACLDKSKDHSKHDPREPISELAMLKGRAAVWQSRLGYKHTIIAGVGAFGASTRTNSSSNSNSSDDKIFSTLHSRQDSSSNGREPDKDLNDMGKSSSSTSSDSSAGEIPAGFQKGELGYLQRLKAAASKPINVVVMTGIFWQLDPSSTANCSVDGIPLDCHFTQKQDRVDTADALYYHVPSFNGVPRPKAFPNQLRLAMSLESAVYYSNLDNPRFMCGFDAEMTYRHCAQVVNWYSLEGFKNLFAKEPLPFEQKQHALVYINSNCGAASGRSTILRQLMKLNGSVPVHSLGNCDRNMPWPPGNPRKTDVQRRYKFCVTMENSVSPDYVTEKLWDGLTAGCVPVYLGAQSALNMVPDRSSIIIYDPLGSGNASTPEELDRLMHVIGSDQKRYKAMLQWKYRKPDDQPSPLFRYLWSEQHTSGECFLCRFLARHRANPQPRYITCLFNSTWNEANGRQVVPADGPDGHCPV